MAGPGRPRKADKQETSESEDTVERGPREKTRADKGRRRRKPLGQPQQKLNATVPDGFVGYWFNDKPGRISQALEAGYTFVNDQGADAGEDRSQARFELVGTHEDGSPLHAYLMAIPREWHEEDQLAKQEPIEATEEAIRRGRVNPGVTTQDSSDVYYQPSEGSSIRHGTR